MSIVLKCEQVSVAYPLPRKFRKLNAKPAGVHDVSFELGEGEVLGIIGKNGSGKSTLLKMLAGIFPPDQGEILMRGSVSLLSGVGVGFNGELTGRENCYLYGALMGRTKEQIDTLIDEVKAFSELEHFFDRPLRMYSSGMKSRLGISVATAFRPDILLIDEVLGVGDASFREKSKKRVRGLIDGSGSVIIVSHSLAMMASICSRVMVMDDGKAAFIGAPEEALAFYSSDFNDLNQD
tara:strand:- start:2472 stop:3179 length:708 start_codon:yes stop_codon:yes gene_type:complete